MGRGENEISIYKTPGQTHLASYGKKNKLKRRGRDFFFLFDEEKTFYIVQLPIHFRGMIEYHSTKPYNQPEAAVLHSQHLP